jgi:hypothetical protein
MLVPMVLADRSKAWRIAGVRYRDSAEELSGNTEHENRH